MASTCKACIAIGVEHTFEDPEEYDAHIAAEHSGPQDRERGAAAITGEVKVTRTRQRRSVPALPTGRTGTRRSPRTPPRTPKRKK